MKVSSKFPAEFPRCPFCKAIVNARWTECLACSAVLDVSASVSGVAKENLPVCLFCRGPVRRGTPGTGALAGQDLHLDCYHKYGSRWQTEK